MRQGSTAVLEQTERAISVAEPHRITLPMPLVVRQGYLEIRELGTGSVITIIEVLSPTNKRSSQGRREYLDKRRQIIASSTHLVEIDLLRAGESMPLGVTDWTTDYRILVSRSNERPSAALYGFNVPDSIPIFDLPLGFEDSEPRVDMGRVLNQVYERAGYDYVIDYSQDPVPAIADLTSRTWLNDFCQRL